MFYRNMRAVKEFLGGVGEFAAIGATLGTLLGLRLAVPFYNEVQGHPADHKQPLWEFISLIGNTATILALLMIGFCWVRAVGVVKLTMRRNIGTTGAQTDEAKSWTIKWYRHVFSAGLLGAGNLAGGKAALAVLFMLISE